MKFFMIEWFNTEQGVYKQEYFQNFTSMASRFTMLSNDVPESNPEITTLHFED